MARRLKAHVHVAGQWFKPGDTPPKEIAEQITNPKAWTDADEPHDDTEGDTPDESDVDAPDQDADEPQGSQPRRRRNR